MQRFVSIFGILTSKCSRIFLAVQFIISTYDLNSHIFVCRYVPSYDWKKDEEFLFHPPVKISIFATAFETRGLEEMRSFFLFPSNWDKCWSKGERLLFKIFTKFFLFQKRSLCIHIENLTFNINFENWKGNIGCLWEVTFLQISD